MNKNLIIVCIAVVVVVGSAAFVLTRPKDTSTNQTTQSNGNQQQTIEQQKQTSQGSIQSFLAAGQDKRCTYSDGDTSGTVYFASNKRMRMDYQRTGSNATNGSMIISQAKQYIWDNTSKEGFIMAFSANSSNPDGTVSSQTQAVDISKQYNFTCENWQVDESKFTPPSDVKFTDLQALTQQLPQN